MLENLDSLIFPVPIGREARHLAEQFSHHQHSTEKAQQVYHNTLAVYAVKFYLQCLEIETDWQSSDSWNPVMQTAMDVADLKIPHLGKLECRPVLPEKPVVQIPPEVWNDRIGYVAVAFDQSQREARILGFVEKVMTEELPIHKLRSLKEFLRYLETLSQSLAPVQLSQWLQNVFELGWQTLETVLGTNQQLVFSVRRTKPLGAENLESVKRAKLIDLGIDLGSKSIALLVAVTPSHEQQISIRMQVYPAGGESYLPPHLKLALLSDTGETMRQVESRSLDNFIQLPRFECSSGDKFSIQVALAHVSITEDFVI